MAKLVLRAGREAFQRIKQEGFSPGMVSAVSSAAGGPKWFTTYGLTRYIIHDLLRNTEQNIHFIGASVGSWQMACALTRDPQTAIDILRRSYSEYRYTENPGPTEISNACKEIIENALESEINHILGHPRFHLHVIAARGRGLLSTDSKLLQGLGFGFSFLTNAVQRKNLNYSVDRTIFSNSLELPFDPTRDAIGTTLVSMTSDNAISAFQASASIPFVMNGTKRISEAPSGMYWDGGMTDYHISLPYNCEGIVLQPHFLPYVLPGWYDKKLPWKRAASAENMSKVLLIHPSEKYVNSLPLGQISDMKDFYKYGNDQDARIAYWTEIAERSIELAEELDHLITTGEIVDVIQAYTT